MRKTFGSPSINPIQDLINDELEITSIGVAHQDWEAKIQGFMMVGGERENGIDGGDGGGRVFWLNLREDLEVLMA